jgi:hypothetical protein
MKVYVTQWCVGGVIEEPVLHLEQDRSVERWHNMYDELLRDSGIVLNSMGDIILGESFWSYMSDGEGYIEAFRWDIDIID